MLLIKLKNLFGLPAQLSGFKPNQEHANNAPGYECYIYIVCSYSTKIGGQANADPTKAWNYSYLLL